MPIYAKLETTALTDAKLLMVGPCGFAVWTKGLLYAKEHLTDGFVPEGAIPLLCIGVPDPAATVEALVANGLWERVEGGYTVGAEKWARHQTTKEDVERDRERLRQRVAKSRAKRAGNADVTGDTEMKPDECNDDVTRYKPVSNAVVTVPEPEPEPEPIPPKGPQGGATRKKGDGMASELDREFDEFKAAYPKRAGGYAWPDARARFGKLRGGGVALEALVDGARRYRAFLDAVNKLGTEFVMQPPSFLGSKRAWEEEWEIPPDAPNKPKEVSTGPPPTYRVADDGEESVPVERLTRTGPVHLGKNGSGEDRAAIIRKQIDELTGGKRGG